MALPHGKTQLDRIGPTSTSIAGRFDPVAVAAFAIAVSAAGSARPSFWFDEAATISAGSRSLPELWRLLGNIDAVHGLYYLFMHGWMKLGTSPTAIPTSAPIKNTSTYSKARKGAASQAKARNKKAADRPPIMPIASSTSTKRPSTS